MAALILRAEFSNLSLQVYAFAPPPVLDHDSAIAAAPFVTSFVHNADMIPRCSLFNLTILLQGMKRFHERLVERGINPTGPKTTTAFLRHLLSSQEDGIAAKSNSNDNHTDKTTELNDDLEISEPLSSSTSEAVTSSNSTALLLTMEEWRDAMENGTPNIRRPDHLFVPGRVLLIYSTWETEAKDVSQEHKEPVEDDSPVISRSLLRCVETDGTCPALRMIEADGPRLFTDHVTSSYFEALGKDYYFD